MRKYFIIIGVVVIISVAILGFVVLKNQTNRQPTPKVEQELPPPTTTFNSDSQSEADNEIDDINGRMMDLDFLKTGIRMYIAEVASPVLCSDRNKIYRSDEGTDAVDGTGWLPIDFTKMSDNPITKLRKDPINSGLFVYSYTCDPITLAFELNANFESKKFGRGGEGDRVSKDGGDNPNVYEIGTSLILIH